jgi:hypothetical protein
MKRKWPLIFKSLGKRAPPGQIIYLDFGIQ